MEKTATGGSFWYPESGLCDFMSVNHLDNHGVSNSPGHVLTTLPSYCSSKRLFSRISLVLINLREFKWNTNGNNLTGLGDPRRLWLLKSINKIFIAIFIFISVTFAPFSLVSEWIFLCCCVYYYCVLFSSYQNWSLILYILFIMMVTIA